MDRPVAGGSAIALRIRPLAPTWVARVRRPLRAFARLLAAHRRARLALLIALVCAPPLGGGFLWLRHSSLVAVEHVRISGVRGPQAGATRDALAGAPPGLSPLGR